MSYKRNKEKKKSYAELRKKIQYIRSKFNAITRFVIYKLIQMLIMQRRKSYKHRKKLATQQEIDLNKEEIYLLQNGLNSPIPSTFVKKQMPFANLTWPQNS